MKGGARDCPYTYMRDLAAGQYELPWERQVKVTDGSGFGFAPPVRALQGPETHPLVPLPPLTPTSSS